MVVVVVVVVVVVKVNAGDQNGDREGRVGGEWLPVNKGNREKGWWWGWLR